MRAKTRIFGEIDIPQDKIITMEKGMIGFSELKNYTLIYNSEKENDKKSIMWLQSMDDGDIAFPVMTPDIIMPDYKPTVNEELLAPLGDLNEENMYVIVTVNVPSDITKIACNFYKVCEGGNAEQIHYASYAPVDVPKPDFHRPEFFSTGILEKI